MDDDDMKEDQSQGEGRGWHKDPEGHAKAGKKGGEATASRRGEAFYQEIGRKGGKSRSRQGRGEQKGGQTSGDQNIGAQDEEDM